jgi:hypothetical protein
MFMAEDTRPKVTMTKIELTKLLNLAEITKKSKSGEQLDTMLDMICNYFVQTKIQNIAVEMPGNPSTVQK